MLTLLGQVAGQLLIADGRSLGLGRQAQLFPQAVQDLVEGDAAKADRRQQVFGANEVATASHLRHRLAIEEGIEPITAQLALEHVGAALDVLLAMALLVPLADAVTRRRRRHKVEPVQAGVRRLRGQDLNEVAVLQRRCQGAQAIVDAGALAVVAHLRVDPIGEVHRG